MALGQYGWGLMMVNLRHCYEGAQEAGVVIYPDGSQSEIVLAEGRAWFKQLHPKRKLLMAPFGLPLNRE